MSTSRLDRNIEIKKAQPENLRSMADCHLESFPGHFMTEMGHKWICSLYKFFINHPEGICYIAEDNKEKVVGLAVGGKPDIRDRFLKYAMIRYPHIILWKFLTKALVRKTLINELVRKLVLKREKNLPEKAEPKNINIKQGNLLSICVLPERQGGGVADELIESFQGACADMGYEQIKLSVLCENSRAKSFYQKHGWQESEISGSSTKYVLKL